MEAMLQKHRKKAVDELTAEEKQARYDDPFAPLPGAISHRELNLNQVPVNNSSTAADPYQPLETKPSRTQQISYAGGVNAQQQQARVQNQVSMRQTTVQAWIAQQEKAFVGWVNAHLSARGMHVNSLMADIARVSPLIHLLEVLEKKQMREITKWHKKPRHKFDQLDGMRICLKQIRTRGRRVIKIGFDAEELLKAKDLKLYLALIWRIIVNYSIEATTVDEVIDNQKINFNSPSARLQWWCNKRLTEELQIGNFTKDWSDGQVLVCLLNQALDENDRISPQDVQDLDTDELLEGILKLGEQHLHIPQLLDVYQVMQSPDKQAIMTYVSLLRTAIEAKERERSSADRAANEMKAAFQSLEGQWHERVKNLEDRVERAEEGQAEYAEKLQEERVLYAKQTMAYKNKTDKLYEEIESLKSLILDQQHEKEMIESDAESAQQRQAKDVQRLNAQITNLTAQNGELNDQMSNVMNCAQASQQGNAQAQQAFNLQLQQLSAKKAQEKLAYENRMKELEQYMEQQRHKFNEFYAQYKSKLEQSNKAGREYREKCIVVQADTSALRRRIAELEKLLADKEQELQAMRRREKEILEQLATQETVFRIQLQELGQFIKAMKQREQAREKMEVQAYHELLREREVSKFKEQQRKQQSRRDVAVVNDNQFVMNNVDMAAQEAALAQFARKKSNAQLPAAYHQQQQQAQPQQQQKPAPPSGPPPTKYAQRQQPNGNSAGGARRAASPSNKRGGGGGGGGGGSSLYEHRSEVMRTKFGKEKMVHTWYYPGSDGARHEVILRHNTHTGKDGKSKRVIILDGITRYSDKSAERHFIIKCGKDQLKLNISSSNNNGKGYSYQLFINDTQFDQLKQYN